MPRTKKTEEVETVSQLTSLITHLSIDYPTEGLNDMARKINEIIDHVNEQA